MHCRFMSVSWKDYHATALEGRGGGSSTLPGIIIDASVLLWGARFGWLLVEGVVTLNAGKDRRDYPGSAASHGSRI